MICCDLYGFFYPLPMGDHSLGTQSSSVIQPFQNHTQRSSSFWTGNDHWGLCRTGSATQRDLAWKQNLKRKNIRTNKKNIATYITLYKISIRLYHNIISYIIKLFQIISYLIYSYIIKLLNHRLKSSALTQPMSTRSSLRTRWTCSETHWDALEDQCRRIRQDMAR